MPPKADYWKHFRVEGVTATCLKEGCPRPVISLGSAPKPGAKKRITTGAVAGHLAKRHRALWSAHCETRTRAEAEKIIVKKEEEDACEMECSEVRFYDVRSSKGRLPFLKKFLPDVPESPVYWLDQDPRAEAAHKGILMQLVLDFQPFSMVTNKGFLLDKRLTLPELHIHTPGWYRDRIEKCADNARVEVHEKLKLDNPEHIWFLLDGWSAVTTSYIGAEIFYISNWKRVKMVLGCTPFETRHTGELMANFVTDVSESWDIQSKVAGVCSDTASNMTNMMSHLPGLLWNGCLNHVIQLVVNDDIMSYKEIPTLLNTCKNIAKAYHSSVNFARAVHEAQIKALMSFEQFCSFST